MTEVTQPIYRSVGPPRVAMIEKAFMIFSARFGQITTARSTQIMSLLALAPDIQEAILFLPRTQAGRDAIKEHEVRSIAATLDWRKQRRMWADLRERVNPNG